MITVYVYPNGGNYNEPSVYMSDDYETRLTELCEQCDEELYIYYGEAIAECSCGTREWDK